MIMSIDQTKPVSHQGIFAAVFNTVVLRIDQWKASIKVITTPTFTMSAVTSIGGPDGGACPIMECSMRHAPVKVAERKNTQVTQMSKNVNSAYGKLVGGLRPMFTGTTEAVAITCS